METTPRSQNLIAATASRVRRRVRGARYLPRAGLSVPIVTILDRAGRVIPEEQRAAVRYAAQSGDGADIIFAMGTTGEWNRLDNGQRQLATRVTVEECRRCSRGGDKIEAWAGITAHTGAETLANLEHAMDIGADAVVVAPLSIADSRDPADFVTRAIGGVFDRRGGTIPVFLYDNADIAAKGKPPHLHTSDVKAMSRLEYVRGIKVTASKTVLGNYTRAAAHFKTGGDFAIYPGNAYLIFDLFMPPRSASGHLRHYWNRYLTRNALPHGVVAGASNAMPREWRRGWQVCRDGDAELMERYGAILEDFRATLEFTRAGKPYRPTIACLKTALVEMGVCANDAVAAGTPALDESQRREFLRRFREVRRRAAAMLEPGWLSEGPARRPVTRARRDG